MGTFCGVIVSYAPLQDPLQSHSQTLYVDGQGLPFTWHNL